MIAQWRLTDERPVSPDQILALKLIRKEVDNLDVELAELLSRRLKLAAEIGSLKSTMLLSVHDPKREEAVIAHVRDSIHDETLREHVVRIYESILEESKALQDRAQACQAAEPAGEP